MSQTTYHGPAVGRSAAPSTASQISDRFQPIKCLGNWQLTHLAARGACTEVYWAKPLGCRPDWPADYAVKVLDDEHGEDGLAIRALAREAVVGSSVSQVHLVPILESHVNESPHYVVMPRLTGAAVSEVIRRAGRLAPRQAFWITRQVAEALAALHEKGWLHGDIKPANLVVSDTGHATLVDLGFALRQSEAVLTAERIVRGSLSYVAPEVMTSAHAADQRSDIYSLGISLFEMLTGSLPFVSDNPADLIELHRGRPLPDARELGVPLTAPASDLLKKMSAKQPIRRPHSARDLIGDLTLLEVEYLKAARPDVPSSEVFSSP